MVGGVIHVYVEVVGDEEFMRWREKSEFIQKRQRKVQLTWRMWESVKYWRQRAWREVS